MLEQAVLSFLPMVLLIGSALSAIVSTTLIWSIHKQRHAFRDHLADYAEYTRQLNDVLAAKREEIRYIRSSVTDMQTKVTELHAHLTASDVALVKHSETDKVQIETMKGALDGALAMIERLVKKVNQHNEVVNGLMVRMTDVETVQQEHTLTFQEVRESLAGKADVPETVDGAAEQQIEALRKELDSVVTQVVDTQAALNLAEAEIVRVGQDVGLVKSRTEHVENDRASLNALHAHSRQMVEHVNQQVAQAVSRFEGIEQDIQQMATALNQHGERLDGLDAEEASLKHGVKEALRRVADADHFCQDLKERVGTLRDDLDGLSTTVQDLDETVDQIDGDLAELEKQGGTDVAEKLTAQTALIGSHDVALRTLQQNVSTALNAIEAVAKNVAQNGAALDERINNVANQLGDAIDQLYGRLSPDEQLVQLPRAAGA